MNPLFPSALVAWSALAFINIVCFLVAAGNNEPLLALGNGAGFCVSLKEAIDVFKQRRLNDGTPR